MKISVFYGTTMSGPFEWVADEYGDDFAKVAQTIRFDYSPEETPAGFYKLRPEIGGIEYLFEKTARDVEWSRHVAL